MNTDYIFKYIIIGNSGKWGLLIKGVGKSCLLQMFMNESFAYNQEPTVGVEFGTKVISLEDGTPIKLQVWDTAGQDHFRSVTRSYYRNAAGAIVVYDITNRESFADVSRWLDDCRQNGNSQMVMALVGNKIDLENK